MNTSNILFILGGAFIGLEKIIQGRREGSGLGFGAQLRKTQEAKTDELIRDVSPDDLVKFGLIPEFVGRIPVVASLEELTEDDLVRILTEPRNALVKQYQKLFELDDVRLRFTANALTAVAKKALGRKTGARGLRSVLEGVMLDIMYRLPSLEGVKECVINSAVVENAQEPLLIFQSEVKSA